MKNYKVIATRNFKDSNEIDEKTGLKVERQVNDEFYCTKERYEFLKANNAVKLIEIIEEEPKIELTENEMKISADEITLVSDDEEILINKDEVVEQIINKKHKKNKK